MDKLSANWNSFLTLLKLNWTVLLLISSMREFMKGRTWCQFIQQTNKKIDNQSHNILFAIKITIIWIKVVIVIILIDSLISKHKYFCAKSTTFQYQLKSVLYVLFCDLKFNEKQDNCKMIS